MVPFVLLLFFTVLHTNPCETDVVRSVDLRSDVPALAAEAGADAALPDKLTVEYILQQWQAHPRMPGTLRVKVFEYDHTFHTEVNEWATFTWTDDQNWSWKTVPIAVTEEHLAARAKDSAPVRQDHQGQPYQLTPGDWQQAERIGDRFILTTEDDRSEVTVPEPDTNHPRPVEDHGGLLVRLADALASTLQNDIRHPRALWLCHCPEQVTDHWRITLTSQAADQVRLKLVPLTREAEKYHRQIQLLVNINNWQVEATQWTDPTGTRSTTFLVTKEEAERPDDGSETE